MKGILGRKIGMTQVFTTDGLLIPVTVVEADANVVLQKKTVATDGYDAIQVGFEDKREKLANKAELGIVKKANTAPKRFIKEFRYDEMMSYEVGDKITVDSFVAGEVVDVTGTSKGKGYQGVINKTISNNACLFGSIPNTASFNSKSFTSEPSWLYTLTVSILNPPSLNYSAVSTGVSVATSASLVSSTTGVKSTNS